MAKIVDLRTLEESDGPPPVGDPTVEDLLNHVRQLNYTGGIKGIIVTVIEHSMASYYLASIPKAVPPNVLIGAVELTKTMLERDIRRALLELPLAPPPEEQA